MGSCGAIGRTEQMEVSGSKGKEEGAGSQSDVYNYDTTGCLMISHIHQLESRGGSEDGRI